jgi:hypothetical protein
MFSRRQPQHSVSSAEFEALQFISDEVLEAEDFIQSQFADWQAQGIHPWHGSDAEHLQAALAATAYASDRTAEVMLPYGVVTDHQGQPVRDKVTKTPLILEDVEGFIVPLTANAKSVLEQARGINPNRARVIFDDETRNNLYADSQLPYWPRTSTSLPSRDWQAQDTGTPTVSSKFLEGIIAAADELYVKSAERIDTYYRQTIADVPAEFADFGSVLYEISDTAKRKLSRAAGMLVVKGDFPAIKEEAYMLAHDGFVDTMVSFVAAHAPETLGEEFFPIRG